MLQNRVDPFGEIIRTPERGQWLGNRGVIHNHEQEITRPYKLKAWITCMLDFRGRHRNVMQPDCWTELFFLDEATAFSAGHRPCFQCRYKDHQLFKKFWVAGNPEYKFTMKTPVAEIDKILHAERIAADGSKFIYPDHLRALPDGTFIVLNDKPHLLVNAELYLWHPGGYSTPISFPGADIVNVITPHSIVNTFRAGYVPRMAV